MTFLAYTRSEQITPADLKGLYFPRIADAPPGDNVTVINDGPGQPWRKDFEADSRYNFHFVNISRYLGGGPTVVAPELAAVEAALRGCAARVRGTNGASISANVDWDDPPAVEQAVATPGVADALNRWFYAQVKPQWRISHLFTRSSGPPGIKVPAGALEVEAFRQLLRKNNHIHDRTINTTHGELTHILQWTLLVTGPVFKNVTSSKRNAVYRRIASYFEPRADYHDGKLPPARTLWDALFDRLYFTTQFAPGQFVVRQSDGRNPTEASGSPDFRCPDALHGYLTGHFDRTNFYSIAAMSGGVGTPITQAPGYRAYPLLSTYLGSLRERRAFEFDVLVDTPAGKRIERLVRNTGRVASYLLCDHYMRQPVPGLSCPPAPSNILDTRKTELSTAVGNYLDEIGRNGQDRLRTLSQAGGYLPAPERLPRLAGQR